MQEEHVLHLREHPPRLLASSVMQIVFITCMFSGYCWQPGCQRAPPVSSYLEHTHRQGWRENKWQFEDAKGVSKKKKNEKESSKQMRRERWSKLLVKFSLISSEKSEIRVELLKPGIYIDKLQFPLKLMNLHLKLGTAFPIVVLLFLTLNFMLLIIFHHGKQRTNWISSNFKLQYCYDLLDTRFARYATILRTDEST